MPVRRGLQIVTILVAIPAASLLLPGTAQAQSGIFGALFRALGGRPAPPPVYSPPSNAYADPFEGLRGLGERLSEPAQSRGPFATYCVRLCDGRYFPLSGKTAASSSANICGALCPASKTAIFSGAGIDAAIATDGTRYSSLENAFVYRERNVDGCTCNGKDVHGIMSLDARADPTLQPGDIVVTEAGPVVFKGGRMPYQAANFTPAQNDAKLSKKLREQLSGILLAPKLDRPDFKAEVAAPASPAPAATAPSPRAKHKRDIRAGFPPG